eukprot:Rmarinus@m.397
MPLPMDPTAAGSELLSILRPVMYTMFLTLYFVKDLEPDDDDDERIQFSTPAHEDESSSGSEKAKASIINSLYYVGLVTGMTFLLVLLMKYNCMKVIVAWITLSFSFMLSALGGLFVYMFCLKHDVALDIISFLFMMYNFTVVGLLLIFWRGPAVVKQSYLVIISALMAWTFSYMPSWSGWALLVALAIYDLISVLSPCGPLRLLVNEMTSSGQMLPGMIYDTNPQDDPLIAEPTYACENVRDTAVTTSLLVPHQSATRPGVHESQSSRASEEDEYPAFLTHAVSEGEIHPQDICQSTRDSRYRGEAPLTDLSSEVPCIDLRDVQESAGIGDSVNGSLPNARPIGSAAFTVSGSTGTDDVDDDRRSLLGSMRESTEALRRQPRRHQNTRFVERNSVEMESAVDECIVEDTSLKLGLGDFIFYSVLVARASMFDLMTVTTCFVSIIFGLLSTLILLGVYQKALPALPISILLGVSTYAVTRFMIYPYLQILSSYQIFV